MFEEEAEEYSIDTCKTCLYDNLPYVNDSRARKESFRDGATFGYNKANKWHFVRNGDLPNKESLECLCIIRPDNEKLANKDFRGVLYFRNGRFYLDEDNCNDCLKETNSDFTDIVIAWQEIVFPEENEK